MCAAEVGYIWWVLLCGFLIKFSANLRVVLAPDNESLIANLMQGYLLVRGEEILDNKMLIKGGDY